LAAQSGEELQAGHSGIETLPAEPVTTAGMSGLMVGAAAAPLFHPPSVRVCSSMIAR
jgi:hypothetical protein